jgi:hypothetical protein
MCITGIILMYCSTMCVYVLKESLPLSILEKNSVRILVSSVGATCLFRLIFPGLIIRIKLSLCTTLRHMETRGLDPLILKIWR